MRGGGRGQGGPRVVRVHICPRGDAGKSGLGIDGDIAWGDFLWKSSVRSSEAIGQIFLQSCGHG